MINNKPRCLWCGLTTVRREGEVCGDECYGGWIHWHQHRSEDIIILEEGMPVLLPLEEQEYHQIRWEGIE